LLVPECSCVHQKGVHVILVEPCEQRGKEEDDAEAEGRLDEKSNAFES